MPMIGTIALATRSTRTAGASLRTTQVLDGFGAQAGASPLAARQDAGGVIGDVEFQAQVG